jgi:hypothetical protein
MATHNAIAAVSQTLLNILRESHPPVDFGSPGYSLIQPENLEGVEVPAFTLMLWRVSVSAVRRNQPPRRLPDGRTLRPPLPLDLHYLLTPWATAADTQQRMLGWAMRVFEDMALLPAAVLNYSVEDTDTFGTSEAVELVCDPLALADLFGLWDKLKPRLHTSMTYLVRGVLIDSPLLEADAPPVQLREFEMSEVTT